ncbi:hypothetical protein HO173_007814 [Letharia columbiana]|uniref:Uncharacterized protein n=1 Tax=Letharia columbiana TaxID=112416 RepID=A0A8H6FSN4_9LECA|nr:uncharacterized protein HO173_007814 [Letharia columbiana]KAF6233984.1 hypothetical protein HO173_007814 [Letharia columbiana]
MPFVVSTSVEKPDPEVRKLIRSHVMLGKNQGKTRCSRRREASNVADKSSPNEDLGAPSASFITASHSVIPPKIGSDLSTIRFADAVEPSKVEFVLRFSSIAKQTLFPLDSCILFEKREEAWMEPLTFDPAFLNAMIFTTLDYFDSMRHRNRYTMSQQTLPHYLRTLRLLRERLLHENDQALTTPTVSAILALAAHAHFVGDSESAKHHLGGLRKIVSLRGGVATFSDNAKLLVEILRCDIGISFHSGSRPLFFNKSSSQEPFLPYPDQTLLFKSMLKTTVRQTQYDSEIFLRDIDDELASAWRVMAGFCLMINLAAESKNRIATETFLDTMASVIYRLLDMTHFEAGSTEEAIRLGLLAFSSSIFLQWKQLGMSYDHLATTYRECLAELRVSSIPSRLLLWLLMVGAVSVFGCADDKWLKPWLRVNIDLGEVESWSDMQDILKPLMWIGLVLDEPGKDVFDSSFVYDLVTPPLDHSPMSIGSL